MLLSYQKSVGAREQDVRERATVLQTDFENYVHASAESVQAAKKGESYPISRTFTTLVELHATSCGDILIKLGECICWNHRQGFRQEVARRRNIDCSVFVI